MTIDAMIELIKKDGTPLYGKSANGEYINSFNPNYDINVGQNKVAFNVNAICGACGACACACGHLREVGL